MGKEDNVERVGGLSSEAREPLHKKNFDETSQPLGGSSQRKPTEKNWEIGDSYNDDNLK